MDKRSAEEDVLRAAANLAAKVMALESRVRELEVELHDKDVEMSRKFEMDGIRMLEMETELNELREAAQAVVDRWDAPLWKDAPHTANYIGRLRAALKGEG